MSVRPDSALARLRRLQHDLPAARIARRTGRGAAKGRFRGAWRGAAALLFGSLVVLCGRTYLGQRLNLSGQAERVLRTQIGPQLEKQLGERVEFGRVETDWLGRVTIRDIFIGRDARLPTGALLRAPSVTLGLDLPGLALGRAAWPDAIRSVTFRNPQIYLRRDARGFNLAKLIPQSGTGQKTRWDGQVSVVAGRVYYLDTTLKNAAQEPLLLDARGIDAQFTASSTGPYRGAARIQTPLLGAPRLQLNPVSADGSLETNAKNGLFSLETAAVPFAPLAAYAFPRREIVARTGATNSAFTASRAMSRGGASSTAANLSSPNPNWPQPGAPNSNSAFGGGTLGGRVTFILAGGTLEAHGALALQNLAFSAPSLRVPGVKTALQIDDLSGPIEFAGNAFSTVGARFKTLGSAFQVAGAASLQGSSPFDVTVQTPALPLAAVRPFLPRGASFSSSAASLFAHLSGNAGGKTRQIDARGTLETAGARLISAPNRAGATLQNLKTAWAASASLQPDNSLADWKIAARATASNSQIRLDATATTTTQTKATEIAANLDAASESAKKRAVGVEKATEIAARNAVFSVRAARNSGLEIGADARAFAAISPRFGRLSGQSLQILASAPDAARPLWSGTLGVSHAATGTVNWRAISPALARTLSSSGALDLKAQFVGLDAALDARKLRGAATFGLSALQLNPRTFAAPGVLPLQNADFSLRALQGRVAFARGVVDVSRAAAISNFGPLRLDARVPLNAPQTARIALSLPDVRLTAARLAPFLSAQKLSLSGDWHGRVTLLSRAAKATATNSLRTNAAAGAGATGPRTTSPDATPRFGVDVVLRAPSSVLRGQGQNAGAVTLNTPILRVRGEFSTANPAANWSGNGTLQAGTATFRAGNLGKVVALPATTTGARATQMRLDFALEANQPSATKSPTNSLNASGFSADESSLTALPVRKLQSQRSAAKQFSAPGFPTGATSTLARLSARDLSVPLSRVGGAHGEFLTLQNLSANLENGRQGTSIPRFSADFAGGEVRGIARFSPRGPQVQLLARDVDAARVQQLLAPASRASATVSGLASALVEMRPGVAPRAQIRLGSGTVRIIAPLPAPAKDHNAALQKQLAVSYPTILAVSQPKLNTATPPTAATRTAATQTLLFPLQNARATVVLAPDGTLQIRDARAWSEGARLAGEAALRAAKWNGRVTVAGASLSKLAALSWAPDEAHGARAQGLLNGDFAFEFDPRRAKLTGLQGSANLRLAEVFGAQIDALSAQISLQNSNAGAPTVAIAGLHGEIEGASVSGAAGADFASNLWRADLKWEGVQTARLARLQALIIAPRAALSSDPAANEGVLSADNAVPAADGKVSSADRTISSAGGKVLSGRKTVSLAGGTASGGDVGAARAAILGRALPVAGAIGGRIELTGTLRNAGGELALRARDGSVRLDSSDLTWRGRDLGALQADVKLENGILRARTLQLVRTASSQNAPLVQISGVIPLDAGAPGLDAQLHVARAPLTFFTGALEESREALRTSGLNIPFFERMVSYVEALPAGTTGQIALDAALSGTWRAPRVQVSNLTLREGRTRVPAGGFSPPATLDAAFVFDRGTITIEKTEFKIRKTVAATASKTALATPVIAASADGSQTDGSQTDGSQTDEDDTLLRIEPGGVATPDGPIVLAADVFNANLSQLSPWVPALRTRDGAPLLRGDLSEFSFRVGGTTRDPAITGSIQGENLQLENYTLDRLRVSRFEIGKGAIRIEPGNLTVVKGAFQSSAPYGTVPWSWAVPGPVLDGPIDVHFPLQTRDFGALVGAFVPALSVADASEFNGSVDVAGTLRAPALSGAVTIRGGQFRLDETGGGTAARRALAAGLRDVSGTVRFVGATQLLIDADDPLRGQLVPASAVVGRVARRLEAGERGVARGVVAAGGPDPKNGRASADKASRGARNGAAIHPADGTANQAGSGGSNLPAGRVSKTSAGTNRSTPVDPALKLAGEFVLRGGIVRPVQIDALLETPSELPARPNLSREERRAGAARLRALLDPAAALSRLKYDLSLEFNRGAFASSAFGGIDEVSAGVIWKTGAGDAQNVRWMLAARGQKARQSKSGGELSSFGAVALQRNFGSGIDAIARSAARDFSGEEDFKSFGVAKRVDVARAPDRRAQISFNRFAASATGAGNGVIDGRLVLDNGALQQKVPASAVRLQNAALRTGRSALLGARFEGDFALVSASKATTKADENDAAAADNTYEDALGKSRLEDGSEADTEEQDGGEIAPDSEGTALRLGGVLSLSDAEIYGAPAGGAGGMAVLSALPGAPRFDMRFKMGRDVQVVTAAFRSGLEGELIAKGTPNDPRISGVLNTKAGQVRFPNARARVEEGRVTIALARDAMSDTLRTRLDIDATARGQAGRYAITLRLRGPLDLSDVPNAQSLQIDVTSTPPLPQSEALQQLLGTLPDLEYVEGDHTYTNEKTGTYKVDSVNHAYTNAILNVLSAPLFSGVEQSLAQTLGLTSVGFEYHFNEPLTVQVTKALGDRVFVSYRRSLSSGPTASLTSSTSNERTPFDLRIEYRLKGNYLLGLQADERQIPTLTLQKTRRF